MDAEPGVNRLRFFIALSGAIALVYQSLWIRQLSLVLGSTTYAVGTVLAAFMAGLGVGALVLGRRADRSPAPLRLYATLELAIGIFGLLSPLVLAQSSGVYAAFYTTLHERPALLTLARFAIGFGFVAIPASLMGGTLPVATRYLVRRTDEIGRAVAQLYVLNTFGAAVGALLLPFVLLPTLGVPWTLVAAGLANVMIALGAWRVALAARHANVRSPTEDDRQTRPRVGAPARRVLPLRVRGARARGDVEPLLRPVRRELDLQLRDHPVAVSRGIVVGGLVFSGLDRRGADPGRTFAATLLLLTCTLAVTIPFMDRIAYLQLATLNALGLGFGGFQVATLAAACLIVLPPTVLFGVSFPAVSKAVSPSANHVGAGLGLAYVVNTVGTTAGHSRRASS
jgi:spermidine synthase